MKRVEQIGQAASDIRDPLRTRGAGRGYSKPRCCRTIFSRSAAPMIDGAMREERVLCRFQPAERQHLGKAARFDFCMSGMARGGRYGLNSGRFQLQTIRTAGEGGDRNGLGIARGNTLTRGDDLKAGRW